MNDLCQIKLEISFFRRETYVKKLNYLADKSANCGLLSLTGGVIIALWFAVGHDFYFIWWLLKEPFVWVGVVSVA